MGRSIMDAWDRCQSQLDILLQKNFPADQVRFLQKLKQYDLLPSATPVLMIAGTNGKGTTTMLLEKIFLAAGYRVGTYLSPHLLKITERFRLNGNNLSDECYLHYADIAFSAYQDESVNWFEWLTFVAMQAFRAASLDLLILEVGLGGRKDVVNVIEPAMSIITTIDFDHTERLGETREAIGWEKAGIFRKNIPAVCGDPHPPDGVVQYAENIGAPLFLQGKDFNYHLSEKTWDWHNGGDAWHHLPLPNMPLQNASTALQVIALLSKKFPVSKQHIMQCFMDFNMPGRWQLLSREPDIIADVAHNPQSVAYLAEQLKKYPCAGKTHAIIGMAGRKNIESALAPIGSLITDLYGVDILPDQPCSERISALFPQAKICTSVAEALKKARAQSEKHDRIIVFGSFLTVAAAMEVLQ